MATVPRPRPLAEVLWRPLTEDDLVAVATLEARIHAAPWTLGNFRDAVSAGYAVWVGERAGCVVAYGVLMLAPGEAQILNLSVVSEARRQGLGRSLLRRFVTGAWRMGAEQVFLEVRMSNAPAIALYRSESFVPVARRAAYYPPSTDGWREDALVMRRALDAKAASGDA